MLLQDGWRASKVSEHIHIVLRNLSTFVIGIVCVTVYAACSVLAMLFIVHIYTDTCQDHCE